VIEAERCQTLPDDYTAFGVDDSGNTVNISNTQRYKAIGNGWTVDVIAHIFSHMTGGGE
jgi:DNA (cytosine-5)-methyltransferase 3A